MRQKTTATETGSGEGPCEPSHPARRRARRAATEQAELGSHALGGATAGTCMVSMACTFAGALGISKSDLLKRAGVPTFDVSDPTSRVPLTVAHAVWLAAEELSGCSHAGLAAAPHLPVGTLDLLDYWARSTRTLGEALEVFQRGQALLVSTGGFSLSVEGNRAILRHQSSQALPVLADLALGIFLERTRTFTGVSWRPTLVRLGHRRRTKGHEDFFGAPVEVGTDHDELVFERELLGEHLLTAEPRLAQLLGAQATALLSALPAGRETHTFVEEARAALVECLLAGNPNIDRVAERLRMSARSLQRRLREEQTSHRELLMQARAQVAKEALQGGATRRREVADALAYASPRSVNRALRRFALDNV